MKDFAHFVVIPRPPQKSQLQAHNKRIAEHRSQLIMKLNDPRIGRQLATAHIITQSFVLKTNDVHKQISYGKGEASIRYR